MRSQRVRYLTFWLGLPIALFAAHGVHAQGVHVESTPYPTVTDERLQHPEAGDWLMYRRTYDGSGFGPLDDYKTGCYSTLAPLAVCGKIIAGYSGGELGVRGSVSAFHALTGKRIWKTYTVPAPNEPGGDTWKGETYKRGGGSTWITGV